MDKLTLTKAAEQFTNRSGDIDIVPLGEGLIHQTYKVKANALSSPIVLQAINTSVFLHPGDIIDNYLLVYQYLQSTKSSIRIPAPVPAENGCFLYKDEKTNYWRATCFIENSYSPMMAVNETAAYTVARSFANFTHDLAGLPVKNLKDIITGFHDLSTRYQQFETALLQASTEALLNSTHLISELRQRKYLVNFYHQISKDADYPDRVMHHDCKISNILFDKSSNLVLCPVDLDTVMPGKFFSDLGDMIRSMSCTVDENSTDWGEIAIRPGYYAAVIKGYLEGIGDLLTAEESRNIHYSGLLIIYMQTLRFLTDYLNGDIYYKTSYPEQNLNRALNQFILLEKLESHLLLEYGFTYR